MPEPSRDRKGADAPMPEPSRDRKGADTRITSKLFGNKQGHSLSLLFDHVPDSLPYILILP